MLKINQNDLNMAGSHLSNSLFLLTFDSFFFYTENAGFMRLTNSVSYWHFHCIWFLGRHCWFGIFYNQWCKPSISSSMMTYKSHISSEIHVLQHKIHLKSKTTNKFHVRYMTFQTVCLINNCVRSLADRWPHDH